MWARTLLIAGIASLGAFVAPAVANPGVLAVSPSWIMPVQDRRERGQDIRSLREVVDMLRSQHGGELISARLEDGPRPFYVIRWRMPDGRVRDFRVDAAR
jgi:hypothetical protein